MKKQIVVFAPHPDDETLGCGGTIAKRVKEGYDVLIFFMTDGRNALSKLFGISLNPSPSELKDIREEEAKRAMKILGVTEHNLIFLGIEDGRLEESKSFAQKKILKLLDEKTLTETYFPSNKDENPDHRVTHEIVSSVTRDLNEPCRNYRYVISRKYNRIGPWRDKILDLFKHNMIRLDTSEFLCLKKMALNEYKSQTTIMSIKQRKPVLDCNFLKRFLKKEEVFFVNKH